jgi:glycosyltransferase involved in cell wall biosynthesis
VISSAERALFINPLMAKGRRIRVAYVSHALQVGGAEEMIFNLIRHLPPDRFEALVCCIHEAGPIGREIERSGTSVTTLGRVPGIRDPLAVLAIRRWMREVEPDIVHTFLLTASLYGRLGAMLARVPIVIGTEVNIYEQKRGAHIVAERLLMAGTDAVVVSAQSVKAHYVRQIHADPDRIDVIYNAVDWRQIEPRASRRELRGRLGLDDEAVVAGVIARLTPQKGHLQLLDALERTPGLESLRLLVVGDGELRPELETAVAGRRLHDRVRFLGTRRDLADLLAAMDIFVLPSLWEGLPLSLLLAMGAALPVVTTRVAGIPEVVDDEVTGLLVPPGDAVALGRALARLTADASLRTRLGGAARSSVLPRFGVEAFVRATTDLYEKLLKGEGRR